MSWIKPLDTPQRVALALIVVLEICLLLSVAQSRVLADLTPQRLKLLSGLQTLFFLASVQGLVVLVLAAVLLRRFQATATTVSLLLFLNFALTPFLRTDTGFVTLPQNLDRRIQIVGDVMPGFSGVSHVTTDHKGFRTTRDIDYDAPAGLRVFAIGGSTTEQIHVDDRKTWTSLLQGKLQERLSVPVEVINTGVSGLRARHHYATLQEILPYHPDIVIFMMGLNDWNKQIADHFDWTLASADESVNFAIDRSILWRALQAAVNSRVSERAKNPDGIEIFDGTYYSTQNDSLGRPDVRSYVPGSVSEDYARWVGAILDTCRASSFDCLFVDQPNAYRASIEPELRRRLWMTPPNQPYTLTLDSMRGVADVYNQWLLERAAEEGATTCRIAHRVPARTNVFYDDCHFNEGGSELVAGLIEACVTPLL